MDLQGNMRVYCRIKPIASESNERVVEVPAGVTEDNGDERSHMVRLNLLNKTFGRLQTYEYLVDQVFTERTS
jgi:hypothetical protein